MTRLRLSTQRQPRRGFTLIELLVVISIIAVLASLIAPAVQSARRAARKMECSSNMRQVGMAIINFASTNNGALPALTTSINITNSNGTGAMAIGWPISILPLLDNSALLKNIKNDAFITSGVATINGPDTTDTIDDTGWIQVFTCTEDIHSYRRPGGLSYVVNSGFWSSSNWGVAETFTSSSSASGFQQVGAISWDGDGNLFSSTDVTTHASTGVIWRTTSNFESSIDFVATGDGSSTTLLLSENLQSGKWFDVDANSLGFGIRVLTSSNQPTKSEFTFNGSLPTLQTEGTAFATPDAATRPDNWFINHSLGAVPGTSPRPSSNHAGGVNAMMCDGSVKFLNESIDKNVYAKLCTSNGVNFGERSLNQSGF
jgi:prepilin-type N-terminal cleavage/methylation domain-containing protein/prepilin-type processing-associated H-X9-DG protein